MKLQTSEATDNQQKTQEQRKTMATTSYVPLS